MPRRARPSFYYDKAPARGCLPCNQRARPAAQPINLACQAGNLFYLPAWPGDLLFPFPLPWAVCFTADRHSISNHLIIPWSSINRPSPPLTTAPPDCAIARARELIPTRLPISNADCILVLDCVLAAEPLITPVVASLCFLFE